MIFILTAGVILKNSVGPSVYSFDADNVHFSMLDSANGILGEAQLEWLKDDLASTSQPVKIVVTHYSPWTGRFLKLWAMSSDEEAAILKDIAYTYDVNLVLAGHYHGYINHIIGRTQYVTTGGVNKLIDFGESKHFIRVLVNGSDVSVQKV
ncbi:metallophosphoesterase, partial [bacterium]|nr:metallophosphoesterase [bacterium]